MTDSPPPKTTLSLLGRKAKSWKYPLDSPPPKTSPSLQPNAEGQEFEYVTVISATVRRTQDKKNSYVQVRCRSCGASGWVLYSNLQRGLSSGCLTCAQLAKRPYPKWLERRMDVVRQRCQNPNNPGYRHYGGRGIGFGWPGVAEASRWVWDNLGPFDRGLTLDRIDNNRGYEPGNLRLATQKEQHGNRRNTVISEFHQEHWPFSVGTVCRYLRNGYTRDEMIEAAREIVRTKGSHYHQVAAKLASMTSTLPDHITVLPYRES